MSYQEKYLKYKNKYLILKNQLGGIVCSQCHRDSAQDLIDGKCVQCNTSVHTANRAVKLFSSVDLGFGSAARDNLTQREAMTVGSTNKQMNMAVREHWEKKSIAREFISSIGSEGNALGQFNEPDGMCSAIDSSGNPLLLVCDSLNGRTVVVNPSDSRCIRTLQNPVDTAQVTSAVAFLPRTGQVLVLEDEYVVVFAGVNDSTVVRTIGRGRGRGLGQLNFPRGLAVLDGGIADAAAPEGPIAVVADTKNHRLSLFRVRDGTFMQDVGSQGSAPGQFLNPAAVVVVPAGTMGNTETLLVVTDSGNRRVQVLTRTGEVVRILQGNADISLGNQLYGVAVCISTGEVLVTDHLNHRVLSWQLSDGSGLSVVCGGVEGAGPGEFSSPSGLVAFDDGSLWVAEEGNHRLSFLTDRKW